MSINYSGEDRWDVQEEIRPWEEKEVKISQGEAQDVGRKVRSNDEETCGRM